MIAAEEAKAPRKDPAPSLRGLAACMLPDELPAALRRLAAAFEDGDRWERRLSQRMKGWQSQHGANLIPVEGVQGVLSHRFSGPVAAKGQRRRPFPAPPSPPPPLSPLSFASVALHRWCVFRDDAPSRRQRSQERLVNILSCHRQPSVLHFVRTGEDRAPRLRIIRRLGKPEHLGILHSEVASVGKEHRVGRLTKETIIYRLPATAA